MSDQDGVFWFGDDAAFIARNLSVPKLADTLQNTVLSSSVPLISVYDGDRGPRLEFDGKTLGGLLGRKDPNTRDVQDVAHEFVSRCDAIIARFERENVSAYAKVEVGDIALLYTETRDFMRLRIENNHTGGVLRFYQENVGQYQKSSYDRVIRPRILPIDHVTVLTHAAYATSGQIAEDLQSVNKEDFAQGLLLAVQSWISHVNATTHINQQG